MTCPDCKKIYNDHVTICISCGAELVPDEKEPPAEGIFETEEVSAVPEAPVQSVSVPSGYTPVIPITNTKTEYPDDFRRPARALSVISGVMLFAVTLLLFCSFTLRLFTTEEKLSQAVKSFDFLSLPAGSFIPLSGEHTLGEAVAVMADGSGLDSTKIKAVYESSTIREFLCDTLGQYGRYLRDGTPPDEITAETLKTLFSENISVVSQRTGYVISEKDISLAYDHIDSLSPVIAGLSVRELESRFGTAVTFIKSFISLPVIIAELTAALLFIILTAAVTGSGQKTLFSAGTSLTAAGLVITGAVFMLTMQIKPFYFESAAARELLKSVSDAMSGGMYSMAVIITISGLAALIWSFSLKNAVKKS
ncbi:MAG: hypothetical protein IJZ72_01570 [Oscillospiraceae bacterium]|nr:hypothetical protein [Oscillospiraceae bacterium]